MPAVPSCRYLGQEKRAQGLSGLCSQGDKRECLSLPKAKCLSLAGCLCLNGIEEDEDGAQGLGACVRRGTGGRKRAQGLAACVRRGTGGRKRAQGLAACVRRGTGGRKRAQTLTACARRGTGKNACRYLKARKKSTGPGGKPLWPARCWRWRPARCRRYLEQRPTTRKALVVATCLNGIEEDEDGGRGLGANRSGRLEAGATWGREKEHRP